MKKYQYVIVSDLHLGTKDSKCNEFLDFLDNHPCHTLILNGDIVDGWALNRGSKWKKKHTKVISKLLTMSNDTNIIWIRGNHDEFLTEFLGGSFGNIQFKENYILKTQEWKTRDLFIDRYFYVFHGDVIDVFITKYKWLSKIGAIGYDFALWLNRVYNKYRTWRGLSYQSISQKIKEGVKTATLYVNDFETTAILMAEKAGCEGVICGHIHQPSDRVINNKRYLNSGDWVENMTALVVDNNGQIELKKYENNRTTIKLEHGEEI
jgi:UDP-2,3-diacylglucosamine pyrophosphatase LpxH